MQEPGSGGNWKVRALYAQHLETESGVSDRTCGFVRVAENRPGSSGSTYKKSATALMFSS